MIQFILQMFIKNVVLMYRLRSYEKPRRSTYNDNIIHTQIAKKMFLMEKQNQGCILGGGGGATDPCHRPQPDVVSLFLHLK